MRLSRDALTPEALMMLHTIVRCGSFAAAARELNLVPSALTYRVRQIEESLDVLLFNRRSRQAKPTAAGMALIEEGDRLLSDMEALANRVRRIATGWESEITLAVDGVISDEALMDLCAQFLDLQAPTRLRWRHETLGGTLEALTRGEADLALGTPVGTLHTPGLHHEQLGKVEFVFAVAPQHPLAQEPTPWRATQIARHRAVAVADTAVRDRLTIGLQAGQDVLTVPTLQAKLEAQKRGWGVGFLPRPLAQPSLDAGDLTLGTGEGMSRQESIGYAWRRSPSNGDGPGRALKWWLQKLKNPITRGALLGARSNSDHGLQR